MTSPVRKQATPAQPAYVRYLPIETFNEARNLVGRLQGSDAFRHYVASRMQLVIPALVLFLVISLTCTAASVVFVAGARSSILALLALLFAPIVLIGSLLVQLYVFFAWLEGRALARALPHSPKPAHGPLSGWLVRKLNIDLGAAPPVPWGLAAIFVAAPLAVLTWVSAKFGLPLIALAILLPVLYARFDR